MQSPIERSEKGSAALPGHPTPKPVAYGNPNIVHRPSRLPARRSPTGDTATVG